MTLALRLHRQDPAVLEALLEQHARERKQNDPGSISTSVRFLRTPLEAPQGLCLSKLAVAGRRHGNAQISERNANFIVNLGGATATDIAALIVEAHQEVLTRHGIHLALNVELLGEWQFA